ncbi:probable SIT1-Transporter of the bacterial siderophore ferrioxamine B [Claviceps purpurea 20.1]|uniref:Probable SIT1-Transporter of the bacterial siderophore ferrioxamine B n=1 Tax=Claviceps purpurea (strain 20.1) TaxID=1111077 RepID=M1WFB1_CLAP2|nr:probable SIT1-Transporter of the bacterial siderophore ferrioxamine B [Claviceps purpurea 20.1]
MDHSIETTGKQSPATRSHITASVLPAGQNSPAPPATAADAVRDIRSPGIVRVEAVSSVITTLDRFFIFTGVFLLAYVYGLDGTLRYAYQPTATSSFSEHSLSATVNVLRSAISVGAQPTAAKIADVFGRVELICVSVLFYVVGTIVEAVADNVDTFSGGAIIYQIGYTMLTLLVEVIIADITSTRARLFFSYIPALPFIINTWVSGDISSAVLAGPGWKWGIAMWAIIMPVCALPLIGSLMVVTRRAKRQGLLGNYTTAFKQLGFQNLAIELFWLLDVIGIILIIAVLDLILVPFTIAGGESSKWGEAHIIAPLVIGILCIPAFIFWELRAPHPLIPFKDMKDRGIWAPMGIAIFLNFAFTMQSDFLYTVLLVAFDFSIKAATRVQSLYSFTSVIVGPLLGLLVYKVKRLRIFVIAGTLLYTVAFGLLIHFRGASGSISSAQAGVIGAQVLLGIAGGLVPYTAQASLQVNLKHEHLAVLTGIFLATYNIGSALGNTVSGAIWSQVLPGKLNSLLNPLNSTLGTTMYMNPLSTYTLYPMGTPERTAMVQSYQSVQKLLTITGICLCIPLILFAILLRNPRLDDRQTLAKDLDSETETKSEADVASIRR